MQSLAYAIYFAVALLSVAAAVALYLCRNRVRAWLAAPWLEAASRIEASNARVVESYDRLAAAIRQLTERTPPR